MKKVGTKGSIVNYLKIDTPLNQRTKPPLRRTSSLPGHLISHKRTYKTLFQHTCRQERGRAGHCYIGHSGFIPHDKGVDTVGLIWSFSPQQAKADTSYTRSATFFKHRTPVRALPTYVSFPWQKTYNTGAYKFWVSLRHTIHCVTYVI